MKNRIHTNFTYRLLIALLLGLWSGWLIENVCFGLFVVTLLYVLWNHYQLSRLLQWLDQAIGRDLEAPESRGVWGEVFDSIYRMQRNSKRSKQRLSHVVDRIQDSTEALDDGIIMADRHGYLEWWNRAAGELLGLKAPEDKGQLLTNLVRNQSFSEYITDVSNRDPIEIKSPVNDDGQLQIAMTIYGKGSRLLFIRDMTRLHQLEIMRTDFVANVSHELRTPLTVICGYLETLLDSSDEFPQIPAVFQRALQQMQEQSFRMQRLIEDLLLLSRLEAIDPDHRNEPVLLQPLLSGIVTDAIALSGEQKHQIELYCEKDVVLLGDALELRSAFSNLIFNAVRYTAAQGHVVVRWYQDDQGGHLSVKDNGVGIDASHIPRLTERFYRVDKSRSHATGGTGLGLAIVKHALLRHEGMISIQSTVGQGSEFICHFPAHQFSSTGYPGRSRRGRNVD